MSVNKHIKTLVGFKNGTKKIFKDQFYELWDALDELVSAFKKIGMAIFVLFIWLVSLVLVCVLPLATWFRLRWERENQIALEKAREAYLNRVSPVGEDE